MNLRDSVQTAVGEAYRIERELGGGGMSHVFVAEETALGRRVVLKVLAPEASAAVSSERFRREIHLAAALQHPHIVPLLASGASGELLWYSMPLVEGETLRSRLARERELPVDGAVRIWRDMLDALSYAHARGIAHRDVKPENVLLSGRHALVSDFGIAKALASATGDGRLTSTGLILGTPAYMAPEQATGDVETDHRVDIYATGLVMYEMLAGHGAFPGLTAPQIVAAHATRNPEHIGSIRPAVPAALSALVMRCLEKRPADRPQTANEVLAALDAFTTPAPSTADVRQHSGTGQRKLRRRTAVTLMAAGVVALASLGIISLRAQRQSEDIPPTLSTAREIVEVAEFSAPAGDTTLAHAITEAFRTFVREAPGILVIESQARADLVSFGAPYVEGLRVGRYDERTVLDIGKRAGWKMIVAGSINRVGTSYLIQARLLHVGPDTVLTRLNAEAPDSLTLLRKVAEVGRTIGQSAASVGAQLPAVPALGFVTTRSRVALSRWAEGVAGMNENDWIAPIESFRAALREDSTFAMAAARLAATLWSAGYGPGERREAMRIALRQKDSLPETERRTLEMVEAAMTSDLRRLEELQRANLLARPADAATIHGLALTLRDQGRFADARAEFIRAVRLDPQRAVVKANFVNALVWMGHLAEAESVFAANERQITAGGFQQPRFELAIARGRFVEAYQYADSILQIPREATSRQRLVGTYRMVEAAAPSGRVRDYERALAIRDSAFVRLELPGDQRRNVLLRATLRFELFGDSAQFKSALDTLARDPRLPRLRPLDRTRAELAIAWARVGLPDRARRELDLHRREITMPDRRIDSVFIDRATAEIALAEGDWKRAVEFARRLAAPGRRCIACELPLLARAYERAAMPDSSIAVLERFVRSPRPTLIRENFVELPRAYKRLGELYELRGETKSAIERYSDLVDLWKNADPELQPVVDDVRNRIATLRRKIG